MAGLETQRRLIGPLYYSSSYMYYELVLSISSKHYLQSITNAYNLYLLVGDRSYIRR